MDINNIFYGTNSSQTLQAKAVAEKYQAKAEDKDDSKAAAKNDTYSKSDAVSSSNSETGIYSKENIKKTIEEIQEQRTQAMQSMISDMLGNQANAKGLSLLNLNSSSSALSSLTVTEQDITDAQASISEGGYWSVDAVAGRIMDMAKTLAGGDASTLSTLKDAIIKGFGGAMDALGKKSLDEMPDITGQTYNEVMNRFDKWEQELNGTAAAE